MNRTKRIAMVGILVALEIVLTRFFSFQAILGVRIGFGFFPLALIALQFGPLWAGAAGGLADLLGANIFPTGPYFPGFTLTNILTGALFGIFLYKKPRKLWRVAAAASIIGVFLTVGLNTLWLSMLFGKGYLYFLPKRIVQAAIMIPLQIVTIYTIGYRLDSRLRQS